MTKSIPDPIERPEPYGWFMFSRSKALTIRLNKEEARDIVGYNGAFPERVTSPEVVHLEISNRCDMGCDYCYVDKDGEELSTEEWKDIIEEMAENGVPQITFGGGEPFMREDIEELAHKADRLNIAVSVTTNGSKVRKASLFDQINFSYHGDIEQIKGGMKEVPKSIRKGVNFVVKKEYVGDITDIVSLCEEENAELLLLTYKPVKGETEEKIGRKKVMDLGEKINEKGVRVAVDGMTCGDCYGGERFAIINSTGEIYPCSFVRRSAGNIKEKEFRELWKEVKSIESCPYT